MANPFSLGDIDYIAKLNLLALGGLPRIRLDPNDPNSVGTSLSGNRQLVFNDIGTIADCTASLTLTFNVSTVQEGWGVFVQAITGTITLDVGSSGAAWQSGGTTKTVTVGNGAYISSDGTNFRIFRFAAT